MTKSSTLVPKNKKMSMTFKISIDIDTKQANEKSVSKESDITVVIHNALVRIY